MNNFKILFFIFFFFVLFGLAKSSLAANHYIRDGAAGTTCADWGANACDSLPMTLVRGDTYYIADGNYADYIFGDAVNGTITIDIKKATSLDHGAETGWDSSYGDGQAVFSSLNFKTGYYVIDGVTGGGPGSWTSGFGFKIDNGDASGNQSFVAIGTRTTSVESNNIVLEHIDIGNTIQPNPGCDTAIYAARLYADPTNITISHCYIHDTGDMGMLTMDATGWVIEYSRFKDVANAGTCDGICCTSAGGSHGCGIQINHTTDMIFRYNYVSDIRGTGFLGFYGSTVGEEFRNIKIYGNIFTETQWDGLGWGGNGIVYDTSGSNHGSSDIKIYNNTFGPLPGTLEGNICIVGFHEPGTGNEFMNNVIYGAPVVGNYNFACGTGAAAPTMDYNAGDQASRFSSDSHFQELTSDPFVDKANHDYRLSTTIDGGVTLAGYSTDLVGVTRGADGIWDRGAYEYVSGSDTTPPAAPSGLSVN